MDYSEKLQNLSLPDTVITEITRETAGIFADMEGLPPFVRVAFTYRPTAVSRIRTELWLPDNWNGIFLGTGNGGMAGGFAYSLLGAFLPLGYAVANTDMGTSGYPERDFSDPEIWKDFGWRSTHFMAEHSKKILRCYYGKHEEKSYFFGASTGGNQALQMAQRFPEDYDGIIAGVPANNRIFLHTYFIWNFVHLHRQNGQPMFTDAQIEAITSSAVRFYQKRCDGQPGDRFITYPLQTDDIIQAFLAFLQTDLPELTKEQLNALDAVYHGPVNPRTGQQIYNGMPIGAEKFGGGIRDCQGEECPFFLPFRAVFGMDYSPYSFDFAADLERTSDFLSADMNANNPDLTRFRDHGGKLLIYSGSADPCVPYPDAWRYMERVQERMGGFAETSQFCQYYLLPGMDHGAGGDGATALLGENLTGTLEVLRDWRENGNTPRCMTAVRDHDGKRIWERTVYPFGSAEFSGKDRPVVCDDDYLTK